MDCPILSHRNVSTLSRPKAAADPERLGIIPIRFQHSAARRRLQTKGSNSSFFSVSTLSRPKAAGTVESPLRSISNVSTLSRPKAAGLSSELKLVCIVVSTLSRPKAAARIITISSSGIRFQHSAARRRLNPFFRQIQTHCSFNTQPPEGGCATGCNAASDGWVSTLSRPKAAVPC